MSDNQGFADYLYRRCDYLTRTNGEIETKLSDDELDIVLRLNTGELSPDDPDVGRAFFHIDCVVANTFRYTMLAGVCSFLEEALKEICRRVVSDYDRELKKKRGNFLRKHVSLLTGVGLNKAPIQASINKFNAMIAVRNSIIHAWGRLPEGESKKRLERNLKMIETAEVSKDGFIVLGDQVIAEAINTAEEIADHILTTMLDATMT